MNKLLKKLIYITVILLIFRILIEAIGLKTLNTSFITTFTANSTCLIQNTLGIQCYVNNNILFYDSFTLIITFLCSGIDQLMYLGTMLFGFFGFKDKRTNKQILFTLVTIYVLNYIRLLSFYYFVKNIGFTSAKAGHDFFYLYGQGIMLIIIFVAFVIYKIYEDKKRLERNEKHLKQRKTKKILMKRKKLFSSSKMKKNKKHKNKTQK